MIIIISCSRNINIFSYEWWICWEGPVNWSVWYSCDKFGQGYQRVEVNLWPYQVYKLHVLYTLECDLAILTSSHLTLKALFYSFTWGPFMLAKLTSISIVNQLKSTHAFCNVILHAHICIHSLKMNKFKMIYPKTVHSIKLRSKLKFSVNKYIWFYSIICRHE